MGIKSLDLRSNHDEIFKKNFWGNKISIFRESSGIMKKRMKWFYDDCNTMKFIIKIRKKASMLGEAFFNLDLVKKYSSKRSVFGKHALEHALTRRFKDGAPQIRVDIELAA